MPVIKSVGNKRIERPGKVALSVMAMDALMASLLLLLGIYMFAAGIANGAIILILPSILFIVIGVLKVRKAISVLLASIGKNNDEDSVMHRNILVPLSRPETVESLVNIACDLMAPGGTLRLLNIIEVPQQLPYDYADTRKAQARELLLEASEYCRKRGVMPKLEIISARLVSDAVLDLVKQYNPDLIIMGSSQRSVPEKVLFGDVVDRVLREAPCEVIIFSYSKTIEPIKYDKILVPTSGYKHAQRALDIAIQFSKKFGGNITSLYVGPESDAEKANIILKKAMMHAERLGANIETVFRSGAVVDNIVSLAKEGNYTLIIIGSTEHPAYYTFLLGSTADEIITKAPCNVLVVRTKE